MVGHVSSEASVSFSGAQNTTVGGHQEEAGKSKDFCRWRPAGAEETAGAQPGAVPLGSEFLKLLEMQRESRGLLNGLSATFQQLRGCVEESKSLQSQEMVPAFRGTEANTASVGSAMEGLGQEMIAMGGSIQDMVKFPRTIAEGLGSMLETQRAMAGGFRSMAQTQRALAVGL